MPCYNLNKQEKEKTTMNQLDATNETKSFMKGTYQDNKLDKSNELNDSMTINESSRDEFEQTLHTLGGSNNA